MSGRRLPGPQAPTTPLHEQLAYRDRRRARRRKAIVGLCMGLAVLLVVGGGYVAYTYLSFERGLHRSEALAGDPAGGDESVAPLAQDTNILLMGLDSRLDLEGRPLPAEDYAALHSGNASTGGFNANVLMVLHVPASGGRATVMSIPRDDYVALAGVPTGPEQVKVKQAYGYGFAAERRRQARDGTAGDGDAHHRAREAGRAAQIETVSSFLDVHVDHFIEVTMAAFLDLARVVAPITVCLNQATEDTYSGADFAAGEQQIDASGAVAFVRQRRDTAHPERNFTDLDRSRRQQAFIASLAHQLHQASTVANPVKLRGILDAAQANIAVDSGLDLLRFPRQATSLARGDMDFTTLPISGFGTTATGESINIVDRDLVRQRVREAVGTPAAPPSNTTGAPATRTQPEPSSVAPGDAPSTGASTPPHGQHPDTAEPTRQSYDDWHGTLRGGSVPCVK